MLIHLHEDRTHVRARTGSVQAGYLPQAFLCKLREFSDPVHWRYYDKKDVRALFAQSKAYCEECMNHPKVQLDLLASVEL